MGNKDLKFNVTVSNMWSTSTSKMMLLIATIVILLPSVFVQETMTHVHMDDTAKLKSVSVIPEKRYVTSIYESTLKISDSDTDNTGVNTSDKPELDREHNHDHKSSEHHGAHTFQDHDLSHDDHSMHDHDMTHAHHDHSSHSMDNKNEAKDSHNHHGMHNKNMEKDYELLQDQPPEETNDYQKNNEKQNSKDYDVEQVKHYKDNNVHDHHTHHHHGDNNDMDHSDMMDHMHMNMNGSMDHGMMMYFVTGIEAIVLFKGWKITTIAELIASMIGIAILGTFYEALKYLREHLFRQYVSSMQFSTVAVTGESGRVTQVHKVESHRILSWAHGIQTCLHVVQIVTSYFLMLIFMTYNVWLCIAVVVGSALGYFIFGWKKATVVDITEHCH